jgi:hypothetical protein
MANPDTIAIAETSRTGKYASVNAEGLPVKPFGPEYIASLEDVLSKISERCRNAKTDGDLTVADFQYIDCLNELTTARVEYASSVIDQMEGYELIIVRDHLNQVIARDGILRQEGVSQETAP